MALDVQGGVDKARADIFRKGKKELDHLPPIYDALQLHAMRESYGGWLSMGIGLAVAWSTLPAVPKVCFELVACGCLTKC